MRKKTILRCIDLLEEIKFLAKDSKIISNSDYVIMALKINLEQNIFKSTSINNTKKIKKQ